MMVTSDGKKTTNNVIFSSFPNEAKEGENRTNKPAAVVSFEKPRETMKTKSTEFPVESYLDWLAQQNYINHFEEKKLRAATAPLFRKYPSVDEATKEQVQAEFTGDKTPRFTVIADKEEMHWREALKNGQDPLPGFDYQEARAIFIAPPEERTSRVEFLKPEYVTNVPVIEVKRELAKADAFFHIMIRMIRLQYEKDHPVEQSLFAGLADKLPAEERFAREELKINEIRLKPSAPEPLANYFKEEHAMLANIKAMAEQLHQVAEASKRLRPRKPTLWRKLIDRFRKK